MGKYRHRIKTTQDLFREEYRTLDSNGCWLWMGKRDRDGYGYFKRDGKSKSVPREVLKAVIGKPLEEGVQALHSCDNPPCFNPEHLFAGTHEDNMQDMCLKGRRKSKSGVRGVVWVSRRNKWRVLTYHDGMKAHGEFVNLLDAISHANALKVIHDDKLSRDKEFQLIRSRTHPHEYTTIGEILRNL